MNKEEIYHELHCYLERLIGNSARYDLDYILDEFFSQNVVIKRGENRHPYADVLHEWLEGVECEYSNGISENWETLSIDAFKSTFYRGVRIKPQEPVYEYLFVYEYSSCEYGNYTKFDMYVEYLTTTEAQDRLDRFDNLVNMIKLEETKRVRNA